MKKKLLTLSVLVSLFSVSLLNNKNTSKVIATNEEETYTVNFVGNSDISSINEVGNVYTLNGVNWTTNTVGKPVKYNASNGIQIGEGNQRLTQEFWQITTDITNIASDAAIKQVSITTSCSSGAYYTKVGIDAYRSHVDGLNPSSTSNATPTATFGVPRTNGTIIVALKQNSGSNPMYLKSITIKYVHAISKTVTLSEQSEHQIAINNDVNANIRYHFGEGVIGNYVYIPGQLASIIVDDNESSNSLYVSNSYIASPSEPEDVQFEDGVAHIASVNNHYFYLTYSGNVTSLTYTYIPDDSLLMHTFIDHYLHLNDYNTELGYCSTYIEPLVVAYNHLSDSEKQELIDNSSAYQRLQRWMEINHYEFDDGDITKKQVSILTTTDENTDMTLIAVFSSISLLVVSTIFIYKKKHS